MLAVRIGSGATVDSIVICHPGTITLEQIKAIKASPTLVLLFDLSHKSNHTGSSCLGLC